jgi:hypothetical protein
MSELPQLIKYVPCNEHFGPQLNGMEFVNNQRCSAGNSAFMIEKTIYRAL